MRSFVLRIIVIECFSVAGCFLKEASEHCFLSIKVLFWCCDFIYCVVPLLFSAIFMFSAIIIDLVPYNLPSIDSAMLSKNSQMRKCCIPIHSQLQKLDPRPYPIQKANQIYFGLNASSQHERAVTVLHEIFNRKKHLGTGANKRMGMSWERREPW
jgi:hypothetical protein